MSESIHLFAEQTHIVACPVQTILSLIFGLWISGCNPDADPDDVPPEIVCAEGTEPSGTDCLTPCPSLWSRGPDNRCRPPCLDEYDLIDGVCVRPCPEGTRKERNVCVPEQTLNTNLCSGDVYNEEGASGTVLYINGESGTPEGDGSRTAPFVSLSQAVDAMKSNADSEFTLLLGSGRFDITELRFVLPDSIEKLSILGQCVEKTTLAVEPGGRGAYVSAPNATLVLRRVGIEAGAPQLLVDLHTLDIADCSFFDWDGDAVIWTGAVESDDGFFLRNCLFSRIGDDNNALHLNGVDRIIISDNRFEIVNPSGSALAVYDSLDVTFSGNTLQGSGAVGASFYIERPVSNLLLTGNYFDGNWLNSAVSVRGETIESTAVVLEENSIENHIPKEVGRGYGIDMVALADLTIRDLRIENGNVDGIRTLGVENVTIENALFRNLLGTGLHVGDAGGGITVARTVSVTDSHFEKNDSYAVFQEDLRVDLKLVGNILQDNRRGIFVAGGSLIAEDNAIAANTSGGVYAASASQVTMKGNSVVSNGNYGIALSGLGGDGTKNHTLEGNLVSDSQGVGISLISTGEKPIQMKQNTVSGTRGSTMTVGSQSGLAGDGISVVSGDSAQTNIEMVENTVAQNARLGIIIHGDQSTVDISETDFQKGNGYLHELSEKAKSSNLLVQQNGVVSGSDAPLAETVDGVFIVAKTDADTEEK